jgi:CubicO group peptidase (beta-lactamase class C family)
MAAGIEQAPSLAEFTRRIATTPLANQPGEAFQYGFSQDVLGRVVEVVTGQGFEQYLQTTVFKPLKMIDTAFNVPAEKRARLVPVHTSPAPGQLGILPANPSPEGQSILAFAAGGEGLFSTGADYLRFAQMIQNRGQLDGVRVLSPYTVELMLSDQLTQLPGGRMNEGELNYGLGFGLRVTLASGELGTQGQYGWGGYATTDYLADTKANVIWIYLSQHLPPDQNQLIRDMRNLVYQALE